MRPKHYVTTLIFFAIAILLVFSAKTQNTSDTIGIIKKGAGINYYYQNGNSLNFNQLRDLTKENQMACKFMQQAYNLRMVKNALYIVGGTSIGFSIVYFIPGAVITGIKTDIFIPFLCTGVGLLVAGGICQLYLNVKVLKGVTAFNNEIKQKNNKNLDLGFSSNGIIFRLNF